jgi:hypothetical protein
VPIAISTAIMSRITLIFTEAGPPDIFIKHLKNVVIVKPKLEKSLIKSRIKKY